MGNGKRIGKYTYQSGDLYSFALGIVAVSTSVVLDAPSVGAPVAIESNVMVAKMVE